MMDVLETIIEFMIRENEYFLMKYNYYQQCTLLSFLRKIYKYQYLNGLRARKKVL